MNPERSRLKILFLCTGNSARSILAEYLLKQMAPQRFEVFSAGAEPKAEPHPMALDVLQDAFHIDASEARSKSWEEFKDVKFDFVITLCDRAKETCPVWPGQPVLAHWGSPDPADLVASEERQAQIFWQVTQQIKRRIELFTSLPFEKLDALRLEIATREIGNKELINLRQAA